MQQRITHCLMILGSLAMLSGCAATTGPLAVLPISSPTAAQHNLEGIRLYNDGKWKGAEARFLAAVQDDPRLPEAHFNLALTEHKLGHHDQARKHFQAAGELAPNNKEIVESTIYRNHLGLSSTFERHLSGGYSY
ncbi:tetratricopeptide repeat protein [Candidatus Nitronereus thalassa]|uniref:Tetratricopeptide repeat protein n=1 Tax=Candidatus Nitronereus thalassa TaxID=3020898 RepID=A0ABU3KDR4_9BACT|nr:tetratricopeptide repeat protein [Candidatus Nitronereus thalassa]MDT7044232.1 tetratricopeptide repeat protein [Candidatus Nitronereus thalassa]